MKETTMTSFTRRDLLRAAGVGAASLLATSALPAGLLAQEPPAQAAGPPALVVVFLRGGADALNILVPYSDPRYRELRPTIALRAPGDPDGPEVVRLDDTFGLHPSLAALAPLWAARRLSGVVAAGSPHPTRSHFDAQDFMEYAAPGLRSVGEGWLNRYLRATKGSGAGELRKGELRAVAMQGLLPRALRGAVPVLAVPDDKILDRAAGVLDLFEDVYGAGMDGPAAAGDPVVAAGRDSVEALRRYTAITDQAAARATSYPAGRLGDRLRNVASLLQADVGLQVAALDVQGWDHHANEGAADGTLGVMLKDLGDALAAFALDLGPRLDRTLVLVLSEFGRTVRENGNRGTDHGHGGLALLLGGAVKGGRVHGRWDGLAERALYMDRDLPVTTDFRDVMAAVLRDHLGFDPPRGFFPDHRPGRLELF
jgi:uncharacterized protein (DUF1501 family)